MAIKGSVGLTLAIMMSIGLIFPLRAWANDLARARQMLESAQYRDAVEVLRRYTTTFPNDPEGWKLLADAYTNDFPPQVDLAGRALDAHHKAANKRAAIFTNFKNLDNPGVYKKLLDADPQSIQNNLLLAISQIVVEKDLVAAQLQLERIKRLGVTDDLRDAYFNTVGLYHLEAKDWNEARKAFQVAKRTSTFALGKLEETDRLAALEKREQELAANDPAKITEKRFAELMTEARTMVQEGRYEAGVDLLEEAVRLKPLDEEASTMMIEAKIAASSELFVAGKKLVDVQRHAEAYDKFDRALQLNPNNASASLGLEHVKKRLVELDRPQVIRRFIPAASTSAPIRP